MEIILKAQNLQRSFGPHKVIDDVTFTLTRGSIGCLLGPSGSGKTTLLRLVAGFEKPDRGPISVA